MPQKCLSKYRKHKQSGQAIATLNGQDFLLGPHGTKISRANYDRMIAEWLDRGRQPMVQAGVDLTIADLCSRYWASLAGDMSATSSRRRNNSRSRQR